MHLILFRLLHILATWLCQILLHSWIGDGLRWCPSSLFRWVRVCRHTIAGSAFCHHNVPACVGKHVQLKSTHRVKWIPSQFRSHIAQFSRGLELNWKGAFNKWSKLICTISSIYVPTGAGNACIIFLTNIPCPQGRKEVVIFVFTLVNSGLTAEFTNLIPIEVPLLFLKEGARAGAGQLRRRIGGLGCLSVVAIGQRWPLHLPWESRGVPQFE